MAEERALVADSANTYFFSDKIGVKLTPALSATPPTSVQPAVSSPAPLPATDVPSVGQGSPGINFYHDFNSDKLGTYTLADLKEGWDVSGVSASVKNHGTAEITRDPNRTRGNVLSVSFKSGVVGYVTNGVYSGAQWQQRLGSQNELYLSYDIMFEKGFDFAFGGKLPGLFGGKFIGGGKKPTGYDGWSGRMMFHPDGKMVQYVYHAGMPNTFGHKFKWSVNNQRTRFIPGKWHTLEIRYVMNKPGVADGIIQAWFDGEPALNSGKRFLFRKDKSFAINKFLFTTYFGGSTKKWASPKNQHIFFDNIIVSTQPITH